MKVKIRSITLIAMFTAVMAVCSQISIPLPFSPVPFSMGIFAVFLTGALLTKYQAFAALVVYLLLGAVGIPVYSQFSGGISVLIGPTGGYLVAYAIMAFLIAFACEKFPKHSYLASMISMHLSLMICYLLGSGWLAIQTGTNFGAALMTGALPFAVFDIIKAVLSASLAFALRKALKKANIYETI